MNRLIEVLKGVFAWTNILLSQIKMFYSRKNLSAFLLCCALMLSGNLLFSQTFQWTKSGISPGYEYGHGIATDDEGNVYVAGQVEYVTDFGSGFFGASNGQHDIFVAKYSSTGVIQWVRTAGGTQGDIALGLSVDAQGNSYITGEFEETADFGSGITLTALGGNNIFIAKYNTNGVIQWARGCTGTGDSRGYGIVTDPQGYSYFTGNINGVVNFGSLSLNGTSQNTFIVKYTPSGHPVWAKKVGGSGSDRGAAITLDGQGNFYLVSHFANSATFSGTTITTTGSTGSTAIAKYDTSGVLDWVKPIGGCCDQTEGERASTDEFGNVYFTGTFLEDTKLGNVNLTSAGSSDIFFAKYDISGNLEWAKRAGGIYEDMGLGCFVDRKNQLVYFTGQLDDNGSFGNIHVTGAGNRDIYIAAYDYSGQVQWVRTAGGVNRDAGFEIAVDTMGSILTTGFFNDLATFGSTTISGEPLADIFVSKLSPTPATPPTQGASSASTTITNCKDIILDWNSGNGDGRIVIAKAGSAVDEFPVDGNSYPADAEFGSGADLGNGNFVVYSGSGNQVTITGLTVGETYHFAIIEYNGNGAVSGYNLSLIELESQTVNGFTLNVQAASSSICEGGSTQLSVTGALSYQWTPATGLSSTTDSVVTASPALSTVYTITGTDINSCQSLETIEIEVLPNPIVSITSLPDVCQNDLPFALTNGMPIGGLYSGNGVSAGNFDPSLAGIGFDTIIYTYTDGQGCSSSDSTVITVNAASSVNLGLDTMVCYYATVSLNAGTGFSSILWSTGATSQSITVDNAGIGIGVKTVFVTVTNALNCAASDTILINFDACAGIGNGIDGAVFVAAYPNPFSSFLNIKCNESAELKIFDISGRLIESSSEGEGQRKIGHSLAPGIYFIELTDGLHQRTIRVLKSEK